MNVLIIDDDKLTLLATRFMVESLGHKVQSAENGEDAIKIIMRKTTDGNIDLVISDIMMPGISGLSLVTVLRSVELCTMPIIMTSSLDNEHLLDAVGKAGANDFMSKPISIQELTAKLIKFSKNALA